MSNEEQRISLINQCVTKGLDQNLEMKDSGVEWIGEIPKHWSMKKITHVTAFVGSGTTPKSDNSEYYENGTINWLVTGDLNDGFVTATSSKVTKKAMSDHSSLKLYPSGSLMIAMYGATIGKLGVLKIEATVNQATCVLSFDDKNSVQYWFNVFLGNRNYVISLGYGGGQPNISQNVIKGLRFPCPPTIDEQKLISHYLDKKTEQIDRLIEKIQKKIKLLKEQRTSLINQCVTKGLDPNVEMKDSGVEWIGEIPKHWEAKKLKFVSKQISEKRAPLDDDKKISPENVESKTGKILNFYSNYDTKGQVFKSGDILFNKLRVYLNKVVLCDFDGLSMGEMIVIRPIDIYGEFLHRILNSKGFIDQVNSLSEGVKLPRPSVDGIFNTFLPIPTEPEQNKITKFLNKNLQKIDLLVEKHRERIDLTKSYRQSLISFVVTGKVRVTEDMI